LTVYKGLKVSGLKAGEWVAVPGAAGGLGHLSIQYANAMGYRTIGIDCGPDKMKFLKSIGCHEVVDVNAGKVADEVMKLTGGKGVKSAILVVPSKQGFEEAMAYMGLNSTMVIIALIEEPVKFSTTNLVLKLVTLKSSLVGTPQELRVSFKKAKYNSF
jgi:propanol-preferring alcohol dehydrogenase